MSNFRKWVMVVVISSASLCATCASSIASFTEAGEVDAFRVSKEVTILGISMYMVGLGTGPLLVGPLSEVYGRNIVYRLSYIFFFAFTFPVAFAPNIATFLVFRVLTGFASSAFLSVAGGSVSDMFSNYNVANPMAFYTMSPFIGPVVGPMYSGLINQHLDWRWTYRIQIIWIFIELVMLFVFVRETYVPVLLKGKAARMRKETGDGRFYAPLDRRDGSLVGAIFVSCYKPFELMIYERMALLLNIWTALLLGILYLTLQAFPFIFEKNHGFNMQSTGLSFAGIGLGMILAFLAQLVYNKVSAPKTAAKYGGNPPPEVRLIIGMAGAVLCPISLFWLAFTTYRSVHWIVPIIASILLGTGSLFVFTSVFTYLVTAYRPLAASALASNSALRSAFAAAFPLFAGAMYNKLGTVGATALLAGLTTIMAPLPFVFFRIGTRLRQNSRFAAS
ncbi:MFS general substrate transporter [Coniophora puteana RWD-64-598 SS2]|uniref:MFS general substrate transporter n=1 Tax=Coniophora puteana (strain RWD-64-598) TaxID=741705 RepID=A0A5M3MX79_CONPW|nr:MFS general substrate transporter [Coniophora puteana RWD-64-598 SS2]EIW83607.1 MFS general substrate transporter [Coniophora puteana RWD-64-598 SS2]